MDITEGVEANVGGLFAASRFSINSILRCAKPSAPPVEMATKSTSYELISAPSVLI